MSRSSSSLLRFDPEIEKTARKRRMEARKRRLASEKPADKGEPSIPVAHPAELGSPELEGKQKESPKVEQKEIQVKDGSEGKGESGDKMDNTEDDPRLCDLTSHDKEDPDSPVKLLEGTPPIEIKLPLLGVLPKYYGKAGEDPHNFLNEFTRLCGIQKRPTGVSEETFRLAVFSFTLSGEANVWFRRLAPRSITTWTDLKTKFLEYYFPSTKMTALKKEITSIRQEPEESLSEYWARFNRLIEDCPNHKISEGELLQTFYQGMTFDNKHLINSLSGGKFSRMRVSEAKDLIQRLVEATREYDDPQWRRRGRTDDTSALEGRLEERIGGLERLLTKVANRVE